MGVDNCDICGQARGELAQGAVAEVGAVEVAEFGGVGGEHFDESWPVDDAGFDEGLDIDAEC